MGIKNHLKSAALGSSIGAVVGGTGIGVTALFIGQGAAGLVGIASGAAGVAATCALGGAHADANDPDFKAISYLGGLFTTVAAAGVAGMFAMHNPDDGENGNALQDQSQSESRIIVDASMLQTPPVAMTLAEPVFRFE